MHWELPGVFPLLYTFFRKTILSVPLWVTFSYKQCWWSKVVQIESCKNYTPWSILQISLYLNGKKTVKVCSIYVFFNSVDCPLAMIFFLIYLFSMKISTTNLLSLWASVIEWFRFLFWSLFFSFLLLSVMTMWIGALPPPSTQNPSVSFCLHTLIHPFSLFFFATKPGLCEATWR